VKHLGIGPHASRPTCEKAKGKRERERACEGVRLWVKPRAGRTSGPGPNREKEGKRPILEREGTLEEKGIGLVTGLPSLVFIS